MPKLIFDISVSLDGFVAGPDPSLEEPLGRGGEQLHEWAINAMAWREAHGRQGGEANVDSDLVREHIDRIGATIMGRRMFSGGEGSWDDDPRARGWWGDDPPFHHPVFVLTHHEREPLEMKGGTTFHFVTDGIESAIAQARHAAGEKDVEIGGGPGTVQQALRAGLLDQLLIHVVPVLLHGGERLLDDLDESVRLELVSAVEAPGVAHLTHRVAK
jgi:dihydrofolate reductase